MTASEAPALQGPLYMPRFWYNARMQHHQTDGAYIITIDRGERVIETLTTFAETHEIKNASFTAIGAVDHVSCGYYALEEQAYHFTKYDEPLEVASATGNIMLKDGTPFVHLHAVFTDTTNNAFGGHVEEMRVGVILEVVLTALDSTLDRQHDPSIGLHLINCPDSV